MQCCMDTMKPGAAGDMMMVILRRLDLNIIDAIDSRLADGGVKSGESNVQTHPCGFNGY